ncbi:hypothetical protein EMIHUDRAFT_436181 [Emiliania huxleyi CCMP1516]|uniref:Myosin motor domain-containing protein n=2 Tax=Emiliania huxleyi TaxID=2903 RepID=A0A0D3J5R9_EMIH1|nr:hypothetical protein EMIHUDRAFT_436181 [Emiliania huxleyi CCMP1516]EOD18854.1 hypothetical protein EMIHUDRAFT_436181 [Emiliania huxleyi CCMP1516]|eukprot:XP_005771283.1 hypothetical protein EMIHUDRAFT_436181 [Emiliania huxleyi CCMP1516]
MADGALPREPGASDTPDLGQADTIDAGFVLDKLRTRHAHDAIYTRCGSVLIAVNPYKRMGLFSEAVLAQYKNAHSLPAEPPHTFEIASAAHRAMIHNGRSQAIIVSGESGAGKTESARHMMLYLRYVSNTSPELETRLYGSDPITEGFGCAKTVRNDNSSRMGKFTALNFDPSARIQGASLNTYLLEKTRVTQCGPGERSYHCFYALLRGASPALLKQLRLPSAEPSAYAYLAGGHTGESGGERTDKMLWAELETALAAQAWEGAALQELWQLIAGVLLLGNVRFDAANTDAAAVEGSSAPSVAGCEAVLGLQQGSLAKALTKRKLKVGGDMVEKDLSLVAAGDNRDALAKAIYSKLFDRLIVQINRALAEARNIYSPRATAHVIGIVDIFGFEIFEKNSLEQLCINFANEKLQALFTKTVFAETMRAYSEEGIDAADISYTDNGALIQTLEALNTGMLAILSEECVVPKGSDEGFTEKVMAQHGKGGIIVRMKGVGPKDGFGINHFAGLVNYGTRAWLDKNKDPLNGDLVVLMQFSDNELLKELFTEPADVAPAAGDRKKFKSTKFKGVTDTFSAQLTDLVGTLDKCDLHFVRCFKSNDQKKPDLVEDAVITRQLNTSGVLDALRVARTGFPDRMPFDEFCGNFLVVPGLGTKAELAGKAPKDRVLALLQKLGVPGQKFRCGKARVFFASGMLEGLRTRRLEMQAKVAVAIQAAGRGHIARKAARQLRRVREEALQAMLSAAAQEDVEALRAAIADARAAGVHRYAAGEASVAGAEERVAALVAELRARREAEGALEKAIGAADIAALEVALQRAAGCKSDRALLERGERRLATLKEEEKRRKEEEARLAEIKRKNVAAAAEAQKKVAEERRKPEGEMASRDGALFKQQAGAKFRQKEELIKQQSRIQEEAETADAESIRRSVAEEEEATQRAIEEEEVLRKQVLQELEADGVRFRSGTEDVLEYAVYLGMDLREDVGLLWIADQALQADDPEGWDQCESPNGDLYYMHEVTKQVLWQHPLDYQYQQLYLEEKKKGQGKLDRRGSSNGAVVAPPKHGGSRGIDAPPAGGPVGSSDDALRRVLQQLLGTSHTELKRLLTEPATCRARSSRHAQPPVPEPRACAPPHAATCAEPAAPRLPRRAGARALLCDSAQVAHGRRALRLLHVHLQDGRHVLLHGEEVVRVEGLLLLHRARPGRRQAREGELQHARVVRRQGALRPQGAGVHALRRRRLVRRQGEGRQVGAAVRAAARQLLELAAQPQPGRHDGGGARGGQRGRDGAGAAKGRSGAAERAAQARRPRRAHGAQEPRAEVEPHLQHVPARLPRPRDARLVQKHPAAPKARRAGGRIVPHGQGGGEQVQCGLQGALLGASGLRLCADRV